MDKRIVPWPDFAGNQICEGDTIRHPVSGQEGKVVYLPSEDDPRDAWRVDYGDGVLSRLCLQTGDKGQAVVIREIKNFVMTHLSMNSDGTITPGGYIKERR